MVKEEEFGIFCLHKYIKLLIHGLLAVRVVVVVVVVVGLLAIRVVVVVVDSQHIRRAVVAAIATITSVINSFCFDFT